MFFCLSKTPNKNFPNDYQIGSLYLGLDHGWQTAVVNNATIYFKGYTYESNLKDMLSKIMSANVKVDGNFCILKFSDTTVELFHSLHRTFPLYYQQNEVLTNLHIHDVIHFNHSVEPFDYDLNFTFKNQNKIDLNLKILNEDLIVDQIYNLLYYKIEKFLTHNRLPIKCFLTGGIDSMLVYSFVKKITSRVELITYSHFDFDEFVCKNIQYIKEHYWAYSQIHHWKEPCILLSGTPGDEFMLRSPTTANLYLLHHNTSINELLKSFPNSLHHGYFKRYLDLYDQQQNDRFTQILIKDKKFLYQKLCEMVMEDFQHWHICNTLTFTPLRDLEMFKLFLQLPFDSAVSQILDSTISKKLIARNDAELLKYLSNSKNEEPFENLWNFYNSNTSTSLGQ